MVREMVCIGSKPTMAQNVHHIMTDGAVDNTSDKMLLTDVSQSQEDSSMHVSELGSGAQ